MLYFLSKNLPKASFVIPFLLGALACSLLGGMLSMLWYILIFYVSYKVSKFVLSTIARRASTV